jgi:hypothetical protein
LVYISLFYYYDQLAVRRRGAGNITLVRLGGGAFFFIFIIIFLITLRLDAGELVTPPWSGWGGGAYTREAAAVLSSLPFMDAELASAAISIAISTACT